MASEFSEATNPVSTRDDVDSQIAVISKELEQMRSRLSAAPDTSVIGQLTPMTEQLTLISRKLDGIDQHLGTSQREEVGLQFVVSGDQPLTTGTQPQTGDNKLGTCQQIIDTGPLPRNLHEQELRAPPKTGQTRDNGSVAEELTGFKLSRLPDEVWIKVFSFLSQQELIVLTTVSSRFYRLALDPSLWREESSRYVHQYFMERSNCGLFFSSKQCWRFGSACFWASRFRIHSVGKDPDPYPYLSHKGVEQTEILLANRTLTQNFSKK
jgi:hypothetical protein